jgi:hypothetical protein
VTRQGKQQKGNDMTAVQDAPASTSHTTDRIAEVLENSVAVVMLRMEGLPGNRKVPDAEVTVEGRSIETKLFSAPTLRLIPSKWSTRFSQLHTKAAKLIDQASPPTSETHELPLPNGCHLIAGKRRGPIAMAVNQIATEELVPLKNEFVDAFPDIIAERKQSLGSDAVWTKMVGRIPSQEQLRAAIKLRFIVLPFTFLNEAGRAIAEDVAQSIIAGVAETLEEEAGKLKEKIDKGQVLREGSFTALKQQFQMLRDFSFLADSDTLASLDQVEDLMNDRDVVGKLNFDVRQGGVGIAEQISGVIAKLTGEAKKDSLGRFRRRITLS